MTAPNIVFVGSIFRDIVAVSEKFPKPGETVVGSDFFMGFGGKGANPCVMAAKLGASVTMVGKVGEDESGREYLAHFTEQGVRTDCVGIVKGTPTGTATILVESDTGENKIVIVPGANYLLRPTDILAAEARIQECQVLATVLEIREETVAAALKLGKIHGAVTILNAAPARADITEDTLKQADIIVVNQTEAEIISGVTGDWKLTAAKLQQKGCKTVVVTLGGEGAVVVEAGGVATQVPAPKVDVVDTTGAGDAFVGSLSYLLSASPNLPLARVVEAACRIASVSVQSKGTQSSYPSKHQVHHLLPENM